jgi:hypothetical protein
MEEIDSIRELAASIISSAQTPEAAEKGAQLLKLASDIERQRAEAEKLAAERRKFNQDTDNAAEQTSTERRRFYVTLLTPLVTTIVLAGTLALQTFQFINAESDKRADSKRQEQAKEQDDQRRAQADEDSRWDDAVKSLAQSEKLSPANVLLERFLTSKKYGLRARDLAFQLLVRNSQRDAFQDLFLATFSPIGWDNLSRIVELNKSLNGEYNPLWTKRDVQHQKLSVKEEERYLVLYANIAFVGAQLAPLLKSARPTSVVPNLRGISIWDCDLSNADLNGANVADTGFTRVVLKGANLSGITAERFHGVAWVGTAWWQVSSISPELRDHLCNVAPFKEGTDYGTPVPRNDYKTNLERLGGGNCR